MFLVVAELSNWLVSSIASSMASLVPEPMAKCAVWALSPISTTWLLPLKWLHLSADQPPEIQPGRAAHGGAHWSSACGLRAFPANSFSQKSMDCCWSIWSRPCALIDLVGGLDDEGRGRVVEAVDMRLEPAVFSALEVEGEGVEKLVGAEPDIAVRPHDHVGLEDLGIFVANAGIDAIRGDDEVGVGKSSSLSTSRSNSSFDAEFGSDPAGY
jgi:hypothetical protein